MWSEDSEIAEQNASKWSVSLTIDAPATKRQCCDPDGSHSEPRRGKFAVDEGAEADGQAERAEVHFEELRERAVKAAEAGDTACALHAFDRMLFLQPGHAKAHEMRAQVLNDAGKAWDAVQAATSATKLDPEWGDAWLTLARCQANLGEPELAVKSAEQAAALSCPADADEMQVWSELATKRAAAGAVGRVPVVSAGEDAVNAPVDDT